MTINKVKIDWAVNDIVYKDDIEEMDINASSGIDKRSGKSDTVGSSVNWTNGGIIIGPNAYFHIDDGSSITVSTGSVKIAAELKGDNFPLLCGKEEITGVDGTFLGDSGVGVDSEVPFLSTKTARVVEITGSLSTDQLIEMSSQAGYWQIFNNQTTTPSTYDANIFLGLGEDLDSLEGLDNYDGYFFTEKYFDGYYSNVQMDRSAVVFCDGDEIQSCGEQLGVQLVSIKTKKLTPQRCSDVLFIQDYDLQEDGYSSGFFAFAGETLSFSALAGDFFEVELQSTVGKPFFQQTSFICPGIFKNISTEDLESIASSQAAINLANTDTTRAPSQFVDENGNTIVVDLPNITRNTSRPPQLQLNNKEALLESTIIASTLSIPMEGTHTIYQVPSNGVYTFEGFVGVASAVKTKPRNVTACFSNGIYKVKHFRNVPIRG